MKSFYTLKQGRDETLEIYYKRFEARVESVKLSYRSLSNHEKLVVLTEKDNTIKNPEKSTTDNFLATASLKNADPIQYTNLWKDLENDMLKVNNNYPVNHKSEEEDRRRRSECIFLSTEERRSDLKTQKLLQVPMASQK